MKRTADGLLKGKNFVLIQHMADLAGPGEVVLAYLKRHGAHHIFHITHPNLYLKIGHSKTSRMYHYVDGKLTQTHEFPRLALPEWMLYIKDAILTIFWVLTCRHTIDVFVGMDNLNAFCGIWLRWAGKVKRVSYYVIDFVPARFSNRLLNALYHRIEKFAAYNADCTWNLSRRMAEGREKLWKMKFPRQMVVPHGLHFSGKKILPVSKIHRHSLVYMGYLNKEQGLDLVFQALPSLIKRIPDIRFTVIGTGNYEAEYKKIVSKKHLDSIVTFTGSIPHMADMERELSRGAVGVAMYEPTHGFNFFSDPGKIKHYLSVGLPVIMTDLSAVAQTIKERKAGYVIAYDVRAFTDTVTRLFTEDALYRTCRRNAIKLAQEYDWERVLTDAFSGIERMKNEKI